MSSARTATPTAQSPAENRSLPRNSVMVMILYGELFSKPVVARGECERLKNSG